MQIPPLIVAQSTMPYAAAKKSPLTNDQRLDILAEAGLHGFGGSCGEAAIAMNKVLFNGRGRLVGAVNRTLWDRDDHFAGHVGVKYGGVIWDVEGTFEGPDGFEEFRAWGMVDPAEYDLTEEEANDAEIIPMTRDLVEMVFPFCAPRDPERALVRARRELGL